MKLPNTLYGLPAAAIDRAFTSFDDPIFIDAGPSPFGGSRIGTFIVCPTKYAIPFEHGIAHDNTALEWGSLGHEYAAHQNARRGAEQGGVIVGLAETTARWPSPLGFVDDPDMLLPPLDACRQWCTSRELWRDLAEVTETWTELIERFPRPPGRVIGVEIPVTLVVGVTDRDGFGIYVAEADRNVAIPLKQTGPTADGESVMKRKAWIDPTIFNGVRWHHTVTGDEVFPSVLRMPGHPEHGRPILVTKRLDMVIERRRDGQVLPEIWDHKHLAHVEPRKAQKAYRVDMSFSVYRVIGEQFWPHAFDDKAVIVHMVNKRPRRKGDARQFERVPVPPAPEVIRRLPRRVLDAEHRLALLQIETLNGQRTLDEWDAVMNGDQSPCDGRYGSCDNMDICCNGRAAMGF